MTCFTPEQLAQAALGIGEDEHVRKHLGECDACRTKFAEIRRLAGKLAVAHAELDQSHAAGRARLLASVAKKSAAPQAVGLWDRVLWPIRSLTFGQRVAAGGVTLSTAVGLVLLVVFANSAGRLSAMERMLQAVREAKSHSFRVTNTTTFAPKDGKPGWKRVQEDVVYWRAPPVSKEEWFGDLHAEAKAWRVSDQTGKPEGEPTFHLKEIHPTGKPGIIINYEHRLNDKYYFRTPPVRADEHLNVSPMAKLRAVRHQAGKVLRELGTKEIAGRTARGYVASFKDAAAFKGCDEVEVWVDTETDLPLEFSYELVFEGNREKYRLWDCRWDVELDPGLFVPTGPEGFVDTTPPREPEVISQIVAALTLYARLHDGKYPQKVDAAVAAVVNEMRQRAGLGEATPDAGKDDLTSIESEQARAGLEQLGRVLRNDIHSGYYGSNVVRADAEKVLLWWTAWPEDAKDSFRVFYGDLRTEVLDYAKWSKLVPQDAAMTFAPQ
jgi:hypothetical protein